MVLMARFAAHPLNKHGVEIGNGLGDLAGQVWRVGLMGTNSKPENVERLLNLLEMGCLLSASPPLPEPALQLLAAWLRQHHQSPQGDGGPYDSPGAGMSKGAALGITCLIHHRPMRLAQGSRAWDRVPRHHQGVVVEAPVAP